MPISGIILTSSLPDNKYSNPARFLDSSFGRDRGAALAIKRYSIPLASDTLKCGDNNYLFDLWIIKDEPNWSAKEDSINRLDLKLSEACSQIKTAKPGIK